MTEDYIEDPNKSQPKGRPLPTTKAKSAGKSRAEREALMFELQSFLIVGMPPAEIAERLNISKQTYYNYLKRLGDETYNKRLRQTKNLLHTYYTRTEMLIAKLELSYQKTNDPAVLRTLNSVIQDTFDKLQSAGFIPKAKEQIEISMEEKREWVQQFWVVKKDRSKEQK